ncbi:MAG: DUF86 domain-containing protein [Alphaproteobacteria bacterium]|nr:DUF86 domain-containing protein [Alphaproteobacteria bacterium]
MKWRDADYLADVVRAAELVASFTDGYSFERFLKDPLVQSAVLRQLQIVGEACRRISAEFQSEHPEIPWQKIVGMRNVIVHDYQDVEFEVVWSVVTTFLPDVRAKMSAILTAIGGGSLN